MAVLSPVSFAPTRSAGTALAWGYREDFSKDALTMLDPADSYFTKRCARESASALRKEWLTDNLPSLTSLPTPLKLGDDWTYSTTIARKTFWNQMQYFHAVWMISQAAEIIAKKGGVAGGIASEVANEIERQTKFLGKQIEYVLLSAQAAQVDDDSSNPGKLAGFFNATQWNAYAGASPALKWNAKVCADINEFNALGQTELEELLLEAHVNGAVGPLTLYMPSSVHANWAATFQGRPGYMVTDNAARHEIDNQVHTYWSRTPIGRLDFVSDRTIESHGAIAGVNHDYVKIAELQPISVWEFDPNSSRNRKGAIDTYLTLVDKNPQAHIRIYTTGVTPS